MSKASPNQAEFTINLDGDVTGEKWHGKFTVKTRLSHSDHLLIDSLRRKYLGANPESASPRALSTAQAFSELAVRIVEAPPWWINNGMDLADDNLITEVYESAVKAENDAIEEIKKKAAEAKKALEKTQQDQ